MVVPSPRLGVLWLARLGVIIAVALMTAWNLYIGFHLRPDLPTVVINAAFVTVPMLAAFAVSGRLWRSVALGAAVTFLLQRLHWMKWKYLEQTWTAADLRLLVDRTNWILARQYPEIPVYVLAGLALLAMTWLLVPRGIRAGGRARLVALALCAALSASVVHWRNAHAFDPFGFSLYGHFASLAYSASTLIYNPPSVHGDSDAFLVRAGAVPTAAAGAPGPLPDIVIWLQESTMDLALLDLPGLPRLRMYTPDASTRASGRLRVHTWGGATWLSEFALLGGLSSRDFGESSNGVYYTVTSKLRFSLPRLLKQSGYRTVALSGSPKGFYNMETAQRQLGFDEVLNPLDFPGWRGKSLADNLVSDDELGAFALDVLARPRRDPMLLFVLSIMQHGPYDSAHPVRPGLERSPLNRPLAARVSDFVARMVATSDANIAMQTALLGRATPTVFAYFGDHQPNLGGTVPYVAGLSEPHFLTSYAITSNVDAAVTDATPPILDLSYLGALILQYAGLPLDAFFGANRAMRLLCDGRADDCPDTALSASYHAHLYKDLAAAAMQ